MEAPTRLLVVLENRHTSRMLLLHEGQAGVPYEKRLVAIGLTEEQREQLTPRRVGSEGLLDCFEDIRECWLEGPEP